MIITVAMIRPSCHRIDESMSVNMTDHLSQVLLRRWISTTLTPAFVVNDL